MGQPTGENCFKAISLSVVRWRGESVYVLAG